MIEFNSHYRSVNQKLISTPADTSVPARRGLNRNKSARTKSITVGRHRANDKCCPGVDVVATKLSCDTRRGVVIIAEKGFVRRLLAHDELSNAPKGKEAGKKICERRKNEKRRRRENRKNRRETGRRKKLKENPAVAARKARDLGGGGGGGGIALSSEEAGEKYF